jgi:hypothetical protein
MHLPVRITLICLRDNVEKIKDFILPHKLIHVHDIRTLGEGDANSVELEILGILFDDQDISLIEGMLRRFGQVTIIRGRVRLFIRHSILSALIVAGTVFVALMSHNINEEFYDEVVNHGNFHLLIEIVIVIGGSAGAGFILELLITYRENRIPHH